ncbi:hypothetical protein [Marinitoga sp. 38H-ov]|uniref:hypothetical protein n=1 Tax=Marinitoga sp. 38H-ov TaxID=1755814 RepID=UPI0013EC5EBA|nr:hypothetical protein [Marinitoga sp. 38H-ov]KAF2955543.1 hypothetical protein AS160_09710 [Marinitoga sp. 38H-ov]
MRKSIYIIIILLIILLFLKPIKVKLNIIIPMNEIQYYVEINDKKYEKKDFWLYPGKYTINIVFGKNKISKELKVSFFKFFMEYNIYIPKPEIEVLYNYIDYDQIKVKLKSKNYKIDYWEINYNNFEHKTTLDEYILFISPYENGKLNIRGYIQGIKIYEKSFNLISQLSGIKDYKVTIEDYVEIELFLSNKKINPVKYEIYKDGKYIETIDGNIYRDKISYDETKYEIIPIYPNGFKGKKTEIIKPKLVEIPEKINKKEINIDKFQKINLNGKEYSPENFIEGENELNIKINENVVWNKKIYLDSIAPKLEEYKLRYDNKFYLELKSNEESTYELLTEESTYVFEKPYIEFESVGKVATLTLYDDLSNASSPIIIDLNPYPKYSIEDNKSINLKFEKDFPAIYCELRILDEEENMISKIDVKNINEFSFSNLLPGKEYRFILYIDSKYQKEIYRKITKPKLPNIKRFKNTDVGVFELEYFDSYKYNYYKIEIDDYIKEGVFEENKLIFDIPLEKLTHEGTLSLWREFKELKTEKIKLKIKDTFLYGKKLYKTLPENLNESVYIISDNLIINELSVVGVVEFKVFPEKSIIVNGPIKFKDNNSKIIIKSIKDYFQGVVLNYYSLSNIEIYNANIGIYAKNEFDLYNLVIKKCNIGISGSSGNAYNVILYDNKKGIEVSNGIIEIKNSLFFDNEMTFNFYNSNAYLYNISVADSILDIDSYGSVLKIKNSSFLNSIESINSNKSTVLITYSEFKNNKRSIKSVNDMNLNIQNSEFVNNKISLDIFKSPFNIENSNFSNNEKAIIFFNSENDLEIKIKGSYFENNKIDIYLEGSNNVYVENTKINNYFDGTIEETWTNERGEIFKRGKIIEGGKE